MRVALIAFTAALTFAPAPALAAEPRACFSQTPAGSVPTGQIVTFNSSCSRDYDVRAWDLDNDGSFDDSTAGTVTRTWSVPGTYTIRLVVAREEDDDDWEYDVETKTVTVTNRLPVAAFGQSPASAIAGQPVTFSSTSTDPDGTVASQRWALDPDGSYNDGTGTSVTRTFATPGTYTVKLEVTDNRGGTDVETKSVTVTANQVPDAAFNSSPSAPVTGQTVTFTSVSSDPDGTIASQRWALDPDGVFDDGTGTSTTRAFATPGTYSVKLEVTDNRGATDTLTKSITIGNRGPVSSFSISPAAPLSKQAVTFASTATDPDGTVVSQRWALDPDGAYDDGTGTSVTRAFAQPGTYSVKLEVTDANGATNQMTRTVTVGNRSPVADFTTAPSAPVAGQAITLSSTATDEDGTVTALAWDLDNDGQYDDAAGETASFTPAAAGAYSVGLRVLDDSGAPGVATRTLVVDPAPTLPPPRDPPPRDAPPADPAPEQRTDSAQVFDVSAPLPEQGGTPPPPAAPQPPAGGQPPVAPVAPLRFLTPFPIVRMSGRTTRRGVQLKRLTVRAPHGSLAELRCKGRGCPAKRLRATIRTRRKRGSGTIHFKRMERFLLAGVDMRISVRKTGMVGKYTRIKIRRLALPIRTDRCVLPGSVRPASCPEVP